MGIGINNELRSKYTHSSTSSSSSSTITTAVNSTTHKTTPNSQLSDKDVIVAIDFGTSRTGVAWGVRKLIEKQHLEVQALEGADTLTEDDKKTPTNVLISHNTKSVIAYGQRAKILYMGGDHTDDYFFRSFKMTLHQPFCRDPLVNSVNGEELPLSMILQESFVYIKDRVLNTLKNKGIVLDKNPFEIIWVLTVPAIWSFPARSIMRKAVFNSGLIESEHSPKLMIALEPECAFLGTMNDIKDDEDFCSVNKKILMLDCGGGTIDITAHRIKSVDPLALEELIIPCGDHLGSTLIDKLFFNFFRDFIGEAHFTQLAKTESLIQLEKDWEEAKLRFSFKKETDSITRINISSVLLELELKSKLDKLIENYNRRNPTKPMKRCNTSIGLSYNLMYSFFQEPVQNIVTKLNKVLEDNRYVLRDLDFIILAGGFCRNILLQEEIQKNFAKGNLRVVVGKEPDLLIVRGAAIFGSRPESTFGTRKAKFTCGVLSTVLYNVKDPKHRRYANKKYKADDGRDRLQVLEVFVRKGDDIDVGSKTKRESFSPLTTRQTVIIEKIFITQDPDPFHISEEGLKQLAHVQLNLDMAVPFEQRGVSIDFSFGTTEIMCFIYSKTTQQILSQVTLDYNCAF